MHIELVDALRCVEPHEDSWLVASFDRMEGRTVVAGTLGCPVCGAEYPIVEGEAWFGARPGASMPAATPPPDDPEETMRLAALLGLVGTGGTVLLGGGWAALGAALVQLVQVRALLLDPPAGVVAGEGSGVVRTDGRVPIAAGALRGAALDEATAPLAPAVVGCLGPKGRLVAPAGVPLPPGVGALARDARHWVAEKQAAPSPLVPLKLAKSD
jgi:hypothetical protein